MNKILMTLALASGLATIYQTHSAVEAAEAMQAEDLSLDAQLLQALTACTHTDTPKVTLIETIQSLLIQKANPNAANIDGRTALQLALTPYRVPEDSQSNRKDNALGWCYNNIRNLVFAGAYANRINPITGLTPIDTLASRAKEFANNAPRRQYTYMRDILEEIIAEKKAHDAQAQEMQQDQESQPTKRSRIE